MIEEHGFHITPLGNGGVLLEPQHGVNPADPSRSIEAILRAVEPLKARQLYYALDQVAVVDPVYYAFLNQLASACQTLGITLTCIGLRPHTAFSLAAHMEEPPRFATAPSLN